MSIITDAYNNTEKYCLNTLLKSHDYIKGLPFYDVFFSYGDYKARKLPEGIELRSTESQIFIGYMIRFDEKGNISVVLDPHKASQQALEKCCQYLEQERSLWIKKETIRKLPSITEDTKIDYQEEIQGIPYVALKRLHGIRIQPKAAALQNHQWSSFIAIKDGKIDETNTRIATSPEGISAFSKFAHALATA